MTRSPLVAAAFVCLVAASSAGQTESRPASSPAPRGLRLRIELATDTPVVKDRDWPRFKASLVNDGAEPVTVVLPGDGSDVGWRTPVLRWNLPEIARVKGLRCGNVNPLEPDEVVTLAPGSRVALDWLDRPELRVGKNEVSVELENIPNLAWRGLPLGHHDRGAMERVRRSSRFKAVSNTVAIELEDPAAKGRVPSWIVNAQRNSNTHSLSLLAKAEPGLERAHVFSHRFLCRTRADADRIAAWGTARGYRASDVVVDEKRELERHRIDLTRQMPPAPAKVEEETTAMLEAAAEIAVFYDGWRAEPVK